MNPFQSCRLCIRATGGEQYKYIVYDGKLLRSNATKQSIDSTWLADRVSEWVTDWWLVRIRRKIIPSHIEAHNKGQCIVA